MLSEVTPWPRKAALPAWSSVTRPHSTPPPTHQQIEFVRRCVLVFSLHAQLSPLLSQLGSSVGGAGPHGGAVWDAGCHSWATKAWSRGLLPLHPGSLGWEEHHTLLTLQQEASRLLEPLSPGRTRDSSFTSSPMSCNCCLLLLAHDSIHSH